VTATIAIPTYNRKAELQSCLASLAMVRGLGDWRIAFADDASPDYQIGELVSDAGLSATVFENPHNLGGNRNIVALLQSCLDRGADPILLLDSDMIAATDMLEFAGRTLAKTDGVLSLYNSVLHAASDSLDDDLLVKATIGGAATLWDAQLLQTVLAGLRGQEDWDWEMCRVVAGLGRRLCVARRSRAQHIGIIGTNNCKFGELEFGIGFTPEHNHHHMALNRTLDMLLLDQNLFRYGPSRMKRPRKLARWKNNILKSLRRHEG
jgi:glycosyltransferase involved in cell wall biosynthesis